ncbi:hypothetical protein QNH14_03000 [Apirhabdus apintestini]|nr:hypothetical protein QNH14_03000 [Enterobacteriaceae bacterium CA-0114]
MTQFYWMTPAPTLKQRCLSRPGRSLPDLPRCLISGSSISIASSQEQRGWKNR